MCLASIYNTIQVKDITTKDWFIILVWYGPPSGSYWYTALWNKPHNWPMYVSDTSDCCFTCRTVTNTARYTEFAASCATAAAATTAATAAAAKWTETVSDSSHYSVTGTHPSCNYSTKTSTTAFEISRSFCTLCFVMRRFKIINCGWLGIRIHLFCLFYFNGSYLKSQICLCCQRYTAVCTKYTFLDADIFLEFCMQNLCAL